MQKKIHVPEKPHVPARQALASKNQQKRVSAGTRAASPHRGLPRDFRALSARVSVTLSVGTPPLPRRVAYCRVLGLIAEGLFNMPSKVCGAVEAKFRALLDRVVILYAKGFTLKSFLQ